MDIETEAQLLVRGGEVLKAACAMLGLKAGGTPEQRAQRLMATKGIPRGEWPRALLATDASAASKRKRQNGVC